MIQYQSKKALENLPEDEEVVKEVEDNSGKIVSTTTTTKKDNSVVPVAPLLNTAEKHVLSIENIKGVPKKWDLKGKGSKIEKSQSFRRKKVGLEHADFTLDEELIAKNRSEEEKVTIVTRIDMLDNKCVSLMVDNKKEK